jgi:hypothetical protein
VCIDIKRLVPACIYIDQGRFEPPLRSSRDPVVPKPIDPPKVRTSKRATGVGAGSPRADKNGEVALLLEWGVRRGPELKNVFGSMETF